MDNRHLVTRQLGRVPSKKHQGLLKSTGPAKSAAQKFRPAGPIWAADSDHTTFQNFTLDPQKLRRYSRPTTHRLGLANTLGAGLSDQRLQGLYLHLRWLSTEHMRYPQKITKNYTFRNY